MLTLKDILLDIALAESLSVNTYLTEYKRDGKLHAGPDVIATTHEQAENWLKENGYFDHYIVGRLIRNEDFSES